MQSVTMGSPQVHRSTNLDSTPTFKNGQIFFGKVHKMYPNQMAEVQIGNQKIMANLEVPLKVGEHYWLQVQPSERKPVLKVLDAPSTPTMTVKGAALPLLTHLGVAKTTAAIELAEFLMKNQLPITKESFQLALHWLKTADAPQAGLPTLKTMYIQQLPFVKDVFEALLAQSKGESFHGMLRQLLDKVTSSSTETTTTTQLKGVLELIVVPKQGQTPDLTNATVVSSYLKDLAKMLGLQFEHVLANANSLTPTRLDEELMTLKPLLLKLLQEHHPATVKELAEQIVSRITAQQIISQENGPLQNVLLTLPLHLGNYQTDITLQWSGRKTKEGDIDSSFCRILFYLDLEQLKETVIDMQVQNRVIKVIVFNEQSELIEAVSSSYISTLRKNLEQLEYKLTGVVFENTINKNLDENQNQLVYPTASSYSGVDIRI